MGDTARYSALHRIAELEKPRRPVRKGVGYSLLVLPARCFSLSLLYYVLVVASMRLRFSTSGLSLLWPSNALLVATLVLTPKRRWWLYLLSVIPAHIAALSPYHLGFSWLAYQIAFNSAQAIACAVILQRFRPAILYFETLREVLIFLGVSVVVPGLANLVAIYPVVRFSSRAALLAHNSSDGFLAVWTSCWANNTASLIVFVPVIFVCVTRGRDFIRDLSWRGVGEGALLTTLLTALTFLVYGSVHTVGDPLPAAYLIPIPFLIWAAVRFGPAGACLSVTLFVCVSSWCAYLGQGPFLGSVSIDRVTVLQLGWIVISAPLLCLAAVVRERRVAVEELKKAHTELQEFTPRLIEAQEQERHRIARELHDDLGQALALTKVTLEGLIQGSGESLKPALTDLSGQISAISNTAREISHGLYPTQLEYLGVGKALKRLCDELRKGKNISLHFAMGNLPDQLQPAISLSLYRIAQETMHNIITHSQAKNVQVELSADNTRISLRIIDDGVGFDPSQQAGGLGFESMRERVRALGGFINISSSPNSGTRIEVRVPFRGQSSDDVPDVA